jgi:hypothetical protein
MPNEDYVETSDTEEKETLAAQDPSYWTNGFPDLHALDPLFKVESIRRSSSEVVEDDLFPAQENKSKRRKVCLHCSVMRTVTDSRLCRLITKKRLFPLSAYTGHRHCALIPEGKFLLIRLHSCTPVIPALKIRLPPFDLQPVKRCCACTLDQHLN